MEAWLPWILLVVGLILAAIGTIVPGLPGAIFLVVAAVMHKLLLPAVLSWWTVLILSLLAVLSALVDFLGSYYGAKLGGATRYGLIGAALGGLLGFPFGLPGLVLGPFIGTVAGDLLAKRREITKLVRSGTGAALGFVLSLAARFLLLIAMAVVLLVAVVF